ncbi:biotin--[acetyl-CoA-carboxylase] ligase [Pseudorhodoplanes sp.]|uniref:biotin--[acetyl-CoA-carboxylase] ligase n=1 Tax=Pseudorhodoplanes sp. TaxID=1934341 RepID=UPI002CEE0009|nr:biotin--[acetyl-CoA-carboxylase] ligase [Pseudorhodoplanes sp.]HWV43746.1 biotin--[acetyl-CoA-carboxylase] ligase [Pseudorhodoplanes sp.]
MVFALGPRALEAGHRLTVHDTLDSTNSEALRRAREGERGPLWIVAREQTAGRGRRGREWFSGGGNLATSLLFTASVAPAVAATLGFVASLAVHKACSALAPGLDVALKWPNDVLAQGGKIAGILLESEAAGVSTAVVVGIGLNLAAAPAGTAFPAQSLRALGHRVAPEAAFEALTDAWSALAALWDNGRGFDVIRAAWLAQARGIGQSVSVRAGDRVEDGIFETLDEQGRLILRMADGTARAISAGDVYFGDAASAVAAAGAVR